MFLLKKFYTSAYFDANLPNFFNEFYTFAGYTLRLLPDRFPGEV